MEQFIEFAGNHSILFGLVAVVSILLIVTLVLGNKGSVEATTATEMINHQDAIVVDVRPTADFAKGHIINAINIPMNGFKNQVATLEKHKDKPVIITCRSGAQSSQACSDLRKQGFEQVYNLRGGIMAWQTANLPIFRK